jgi:drug/metabolite transporter (DMT)-like permease
MDDKFQLHKKKQLKTGNLVTEGGQQEKDVVNWENRKAAIIYMNLFCVFQMIHHSLAKIATVNKIHVADLCFFRSGLTGLIALVGAWQQGKHVFNDVPEKFKLLLTFRGAVCLAACVCLIWGVGTIPLFIMTVIINTRPFWLSLMSYFILKESVTRSEFICLTGCFIGVVIIALSKIDNP